MCLRLVLLVVGAMASPTMLVVDLVTTPPPLTEIIAAQTCVGLLNRDLSGPAAYTLLSARDSVWLAELGYGAPAPSPLSDVFAACFATVAKGHILYDYDTQQALIPQLTTVAGVLDAVLLTSKDAWAANTTCVFDATSEWTSFDDVAATRYVYEHWVNQTTTMAKSNPGYDVHGHPIDPPLTKQPNPGLFDFVVKERLFNFWLPNGCIPGTPDHALMAEMLGSNNTWPRPVTVYGYDDTFPLAGDLFEAETTCVLSRRNMGQVASDGLNNLSFLSRKPKVTTPVTQSPTGHAVYNSSKTYYAMVIGDGDNVNFLKGARYDWITQRVKKCAESPEGCFPLLWSLSPQLLHLAPDMLQWYLNQSHTTKKDWFVLPPSGDLYAYPGIMNPEDQDQFVARTENDCRLLNTSATVAWEFTATWERAIKDYFPKYSAANVVNALFAVNVPYMIPILAFKQHEYFKVLGDSANTVLFKPREWRGESGIGPQYKNATAMADEINKYPLGTVTHMYLTSDGGASLDSLDRLVVHLAEHVEIVDHVTLASMALQSAAIISSVVKP